MANLKKYTRASLGHMFAHYGREKDENGEYVKFGNKKIDPERTHLNYNLAADDQKLSSRDFMEKRLGEVFCQNRKDVNVMCSWVLTAPADLPAEDHKDFFKNSYEFLCARYGKENVISANVHMDESSPHMHFAFIPVCKDKKRGEKVCAKKVCSKSDLESFHKDLSKHLERTMGRDVGVLNGATIDGNKTVEQLKKITELKGELSELETAIDFKRQEMELLERKEDEIAERIQKKVFSNVDEFLQVEVNQPSEKAVEDVEKLYKQFSIELVETEEKEDPNKLFSKKVTWNGSRLNFAPLGSKKDASWASEKLKSLIALIDFAKQIRVKLRVKDNVKGLVTEEVRREKMNLNEVLKQAKEEAREWNATHAREKKKNHDRDRE